MDGSDFLIDANGQKLQQTGLELDLETLEYVEYTKDYIGGIEYKDGVLESIGHAAGRIVYKEGIPYFEYYLKDHLGNVRVVFRQFTEEGSSTPTGDYPEILQENNYYPFGMTMEGAWKEQRNTPSNKYLYNGKEASDDGIGLLDYGARWYDPAIGRWTSVDPLASDFASWSPYNYVLGNPIRLIDPDGRAPEDIIVLLASNGAGGYGHTALLIGDDQNGWTFISKEGRQDDAGGSSNNELSGGPALPGRKKAFNTLEEFQNDSDFSEYDKSVRLETTEQEDQTALDVMSKEAESDYNVLYNNCADACSKTLSKVGLDPGWDDTRSLNPQPKNRFKLIKRNNKNKIVEPTESSESSESTESTEQEQNE